MDNIKHILRKILIKEGVSDLAYHVTRIDSLYSMLNQNKIYTSPAITDIEKTYANGRLYYFSTTSSRYVNQGYAATQPLNKGLVVLELNGRILNANFKSKRVDYWGKQNRDPLKYKAQLGGDPNYLESFMKDDEMEDRIITNKAYISPLDRYIISIHVLLPTDPRNIGDNMVKYIDQKSRDLDIQIYWYSPNDVNNFYLLKKSKSISFKEVMIHLSSIGTGFEPHFKETVYPQYGFYVVLGVIYKFGSKDFINNLNENDVFLDILNSNGETFDKFIDKMKSYDGYKLKHINTYEIKDYSNSINNFLHNTRKTNISIIREITIQFFAVMKYMKVKGIEELMEKIYEMSEK